MFSNRLRGGVVGWHQSLAASLLARRQQWAFPFDPVHEHRGEDAVTLVVEHLRGVRVEELAFAAVREEVGPAAEYIAEGGTGPTVNPLGGDHAEVQRCGHIEVHVELVDLRAILGRIDVEFDEAGHGLFAGGLADAQVSWLAAGRTNAAGLEAQAIESALLGADLTEPLRRKGSLDPAGEEELSERSLDAEAIQRHLGGLQIAVMHLSRRHAYLAGVAGFGGESPVEHRVGGAVIPVHVRRREGEGGADAIEAVPERIFVQAARDGGIVAHTEQVIDGVLIFLTAEAIMSDGGTCRQARRPSFLEAGVEVRNEGGHLCLGGLGLLVLLGRHLAGVHLLHGFRPMMGVGAQFEITRELVEAEVAFFLIGPVAAGAVLLDEGFVGFRCAGGADQAEA